MKKLLIIIFLIVPFVSLAQIDFTADPPQVEGMAGLETALDRVFSFMFWGLVALTIGFMIAAGYAFLTAAGDPEKTTKAKKMIIGAVISIVVALFATGLYNIVKHVIMG